MSTALPAPGLVQSFALIIAGLCRTTASRIAVDRAAGPFLVRAFTRLHRLAARFALLVARVQAGKLRPQPSRPAAGAIRTPRRKPRLPESSAWLLRLVPGTAVYAGQVQTLLADPETTALLEAAPQAGRILRPLCRMLAIPLPDHLRRPKPSPQPQPAVADTAEPPAQCPPTAWPSPPSRVARASPGRTITTGLPPLPD